VSEDDLEISFEIRGELALADVGVSALNKIMAINNARTTISIFDFTENIMSPDFVQPESSPIAI